MIGPNRRISIHDSQSDSKNDKVRQFRECYTGIGNLHAK
jgi:hypothetical protein